MKSYFTYYWTLNGVIAFYVRASHIHNYFLRFLVDIR